MPVNFFYSTRSQVNHKLLERSLEALLSYSQKKHACLELRLVGLRRIYTLNQRYLKKSKITDVLSFPLDSKPIAKNAPWHLGELVIATPVAQAQAKRAGRSLEQQILRLAVHGFVHLQGYDHELGEKQRLQFEKLEKKYLKFLDQKGLMPWDGLLQF